MQSEQPQPIYLRDYTPPAYWVNTVDLIFQLNETVTQVCAELHCVANTHYAEAQPLVLDGENLHLVSISLDDQPLGSAAYSLTEQSLTIHQVPSTFTLRIVTEIKPQENTSLQGLYQSGDLFCTQCEANGFRRITYYPDRPDVMASFTTRIEACKKRYPVLLANGNKIDSGSLPGDRHWVSWRDPHKKPAYLFALVAGDLVSLDDTFRTCSGREVCLQIFTEAKDHDKCEHAMAALKKAMRWDEEVFNLEYDLDIFMLVAVDSFNFGAMENKGLNIFNSKYVLAKPETATDADFDAITGVVGHEYFHNWTGNRVTLRDWFQLSLKEGLTVFRDQEFSSDMTSRAVKRVEDVRLLQTVQFAEDAGPMAHPIRPESYIEMNNFYTVTVYEKGAEVIRMLYTLLGKERFHAGMAIYFQRHDGSAATTDDFVQAMEAASDMDLTQFRRWYAQAGTPELTCQWAFDAAKQEFRLKVTQLCPPTPGQKTKLPLHLPLSIGLLDEAGQAIPLRQRNEPANAASTTVVLSVTEPEHTFIFSGITRTPKVPALLRGFSAPVKLKADYTQDELVFLLMHETDEVARWAAGQQLSRIIILELIQAQQNNQVLEVPAAYCAALRQVLNEEKSSPALRAMLLTLPTVQTIVDAVTEVDVEAIHGARVFLREAVAVALRDDCLAMYQQLTEQQTYAPTPEQIGRRSLRNSCLAYLMALPAPEVECCHQQFQTADNMTDTMAALTALCNHAVPERETALQKFYDAWRHESLVMDKWLTVQASAELPNTLTEVKRLLQDPVFDETNPNKVRSLIGAFAMRNFSQFHHTSGAGYRFVADQIIHLDGINSLIAARLAGAFLPWRKYAAVQRDAMHRELTRIVKTQGLSRGVYEIVSKCLADSTTA